MTFQPGQSGNPGGRPSVKPWRDALMRAIKRRESDDPKALEKLADKLLRAVDNMDITAIRELADRLDGKVPQAIGGTGDLPPIALQAIQRTIVDPKIVDVTPVKVIEKPKRANKSLTQSPTESKT